MPYISQKRKDELKQVDAFNNPRKPLNAGDLTYLLYRECLVDELDAAEPLCCQLVELINAFLPSDPRYADFAVVLGSLDATDRELYRREKHGSDTEAVLESVADEFYENVVAPYEDKKIEENGDVTCD